MQESTELFQHCKTGQIYAIRRDWDGEIVGSAGPLNLNDIKNIESLIVTPDENEWIQENGKELILIYSEALGISKERIRDIANYVKDLEEGLYEWDYDQMALQTEYAKLYCTIKSLMDLTFKTSDRKLKSTFAILERRARKCLDYIEKRLAVRNKIY